MKKVPFFFAVFVVIIGLSACVSQTKYKKAIGEYQEKIKELEAANRSLAASIEADKASLVAERNAAIIAQKEEHAVNQELSKQNDSLLQKQKEQEERTDMVSKSATQKVLAVEAKLKQAEEELRKLRGN